MKTTQIDLLSRCGFLWCAENGHKKTRRAAGSFADAFALLNAMRSVVVCQLIQDGWVFQRRGVLCDGFVFRE